LFVLLPNAKFNTAASLKKIGQELTMKGPEFYI